MHGALRLRGALRIIGFVAASVHVAAAASAQSVEKFYRGKTLTFIYGGEAGSSYDLNARMVAKYFVHHLPGHPTSVVQTMPGAGGTRAANHIYSIAPKDGTIIGAVQRLVPFGPLMGDPAARYDTRKMHWLGSTSKEIAIVAVWHTSRQQTAQDLFNRETVVAGTQPGTDSVLYANVLNNVIGTKLKVISGYSGAGAMLLAMERGEVEGIANWSWSDVAATKPEWLADKKIRILLQLGLRKAPDLTDIPLVMDFAKNDDEKRLLEFFMGMKDVGRPFFVAPGVPSDRVRALQDAFMATMKDPDFVAEAGKENRVIDPVSGPEMHALLDTAYALPAALVKRARAAVNPAPAR